MVAVTLAKDEHLLRIEYLGFALLISHLSNVNFKNSKIFKLILFSLN